MSNTSIPTPPGFEELTKSEQLRYLQSLWDQISEHPQEIPVPESHLELVEKRLKRYREGATSSRSAFDVIDRLTEKRR